jgi:hypothetical protein
VTRKIAVFSHAAVIGERPKIARLDRELQNERMFAPFGRGVIRGWKDLHAGAAPSPGTGRTEAAKTVVAPDLHASIEKGSRNLIADPLPFNGVECRPRLYGDYLLAERECNTAIRAGKREIQFLRIA